MSTQFQKTQTVPGKEYLATRAVIWRDVYNDQYLIAPPVYTSRDLAEGCPGICYTNDLEDALATASVIVWDPSRVQPYTPPPACSYFKAGTDDEQKNEILSRLDRARSVLEDAVYDMDTQDCLKARHLRKLETLMGKIEAFTTELDDLINN
tara:strand:- start:539 stop:991 length:453 start_codon:yes stop_codon:yes gene_type:complete